MLNSWRRMRRAAHEALAKKAVQGYHPIQTKEATILVSSLLLSNLSSANLKQDGHFKRLAASMIMSIVYDYPTVVSEHDHTIEKVDRYNDHVSYAVIMGSYLVDIFPWMIHIPERSWLSVCFLIMDIDGRTQICEMEAGRLNSICRDLGDVQRPFQSC
jgi:hypothetical protein